MLTVEILLYSLTLWLGLYLIARDPTVPQLFLAGLGLVAYALSLATDLLAAQEASSALFLWAARLHWPLLFLPALCWFGATVYLLPETTPLRRHLSRLLTYALLPAAVPLLMLSAGSNLILDFSANPPQPGPLYLVFGGAILLLMALALGLAAHSFRTSTENKKSLGLLLVAGIFFGLSAGLLLFPLEWLPRAWLLPGISMDVIALGIVIALLDAFDQGETLLPDLLRAGAGSALFGLLFGGPVLLTMSLVTGVTGPMLLLLLTLITLALAAQTFSDQIQTGLDRLIFRTFPQLRQSRAELRTAARVLPRLNPSLDLDALPQAKFSRLTRRALSHMGNLPRLASSPLTQLSLIDARLAQRQAPDSTLERAAELKSLLTESILRLKPRHKGDFGASEEWRHYNALYFPYVVGLKPYSRRADHDYVDETAQEALDWFKTYVPERTLYNWQTAAAKLVARDLRERQQKQQKTD